MRARTMVVAVAGGIVLSAAGAAAQDKAGVPTHEFGVDVALTYSKIGSGCSSDCGVFEVLTPVDVRIGFLLSGPVSVEPRFSLEYMNQSGAHVLDFTPGVNVLFQLGHPAGRRYVGPYLTFGGAIELVDAGGGGMSSSSASQASVNAGLGFRSGSGPLLTRPEVFVRYRFENTSKGIPSSFEVGLRLGLSFLH